MARLEAIGATPDKLLPLNTAHNLGQLSLANSPAISPTESNSYVDADMSAFVAFADHVDGALLVDVDLLRKTIYHDFYHGAGKTIIAPTQEQMQSYSDVSIQAARDIRNVTEENDLAVKYTMSLGWQAYLINEGYDTLKPVGRFYLNTKPDTTNSTMVALTTQLAEGGVRADIKAALAANDDDRLCVTHRGEKKDRDNFPASEIDTADMTEIFNRTDKIVIYVNPEDSQKVMSLISEYVTTNREAMESSAPLFTKPMLTKDGSKLDGVGFAEEPIIQSRELRRKLRAQSYGDFISSVLAHMLVENGIPNDAQSTIKQLLADCNRNPQDPALNEPSAFNFN